MPTKNYGKILNVTYTRTYDGDTSFFDLTNTHPVFGQDIGIRVLGVDTPEIRSKANCEKEFAYEARNFVETLLKNAISIDLNNVGRDKYFRVLANITYDGKDLSHELFKYHLAVPYDGGTKATVDWCAQQELFHQTEWYIKEHGETGTTEGDL